MGLFKLLQRNKNFRRYILKLLMMDFIFSAYVYGILKLVDYIFSQLIIGYQITESYLVSTVTFFTASLFFFYFAIKYNWNRLFPYLSMAIAVFFPLGTISSLASIYVGIPEDTYIVYMENFCAHKASAELCGEALAHMVLSMTIRALPLVLSIPYLYWFGLNYLGIENPRAHLNG